MLILLVERLILEPDLLLLSHLYVDLHRQIPITEEAGFTIHPEPIILLSVMLPQVEPQRQQGLQRQPEHILPQPDRFLLLLVQRQQEAQVQEAAVADREEDKFI